MSVATELTRIQNAKAGLKTAIEAKGVTVSSSALLDAYPALVDSIQSGSPQEKLLNFYDYDGTLIASYEGSEIAGLTALPTAPDHSTDEVPLTFDEWNWTLAEIKEYYTANPNSMIIVGANYHTADGKTHVFFTIEDVNNGNCSIRYSNQATVNWGDGTTNTSEYIATHTYSQPGTYHCVIDTSPDTTHLRFGDSSIKSEFSNVTKVFFQAGINFNDYEFAYCHYLQVVSIPSGMVHNNLRNTFYNCFNLKCIAFPRQAGNITGSLMLINCYADVISYPGNATGIEGGGVNISNLTIPSGVTTIGENLFNANNRIKTLIFPNTVTSIGLNAFYGCNHIQNVTLPNSLTSIERQFFQNCSSLRIITIPETVTTIGNSAFNSSGLLSITVKATTPPTLGNTTALPTNPGMKIYVPAGTLATYQAATNWSNFASYMEELPE